MLGDVAVAVNPTDERYKVSTSSLPIFSPKDSCCFFFVSSPFTGKRTDGCVWSRRSTRILFSGLTGKAACYRTTTLATVPATTTMTMTEGGSGGRGGLPVYGVYIHLEEKGGMQEPADIGENVRVCWSFVLSSSLEGTKKGKKRRTRGAGKNTNRSKGSITIEGFGEISLRPVFFLFVVLGFWRRSSNQPPSSSGAVFSSLYGSGLLFAFCSSLPCSSFSPFRVW